MEKNTIITGVFLTISLPVIAYVFGLHIVILLASIFYVLRGIIALTSPNINKKMLMLFNPSSFKAYSKKDDEFKEHIRQEPFGYILTGLVMVYFSYKAYLNPVNDNKYIILLMLFIPTYYFGETYSMIKSKEWKQYKKISMYVTAVLVALIVIVFYKFIF